MNKSLNFFAIALLGGLSIAPYHALADLEVSASVSIHATAEFYEPLTPHGTWVEVGSYGRCWRPSRVVVGWRPYCDGYWEWTDCGWYWVSDEPWAWACYHYGSWAYDSAGWFWVPAVEWAPAWVYWREGGGHIGWAPCGPRGYVVAPSLFVFVETSHFQEHHRHDSVIINNTTIIKKTTEIKNASREENRKIDGKSQKVVVNNGPGVDRIERATGKKFTAVSVRQADQRTQVPEKLRRENAATTDKQKPSAIQEQPKPESDRKPVPGKTPEVPDKDNKKIVTPDKDTVVPRDRTLPPEKKVIPPPDNVTPPNKDKRPPQEEVVPPPNRPLMPGRPSGGNPPSQVTPPGSPDGKGEGKGNPDKGQGGEGHDKTKDKDKP